MFPLFVLAAIAASANDACEADFKCKEGGDCVLKGASTGRLLADDAKNKTKTKCDDTLKGKCKAITADKNTCEAEKGCKWTDANTTKCELAVSECECDKSGAHAIIPFVLALLM